MDNYGSIDDLLARYLMDELNEQEKEFVRAWIDKDEENSKHFEELQNTWRLMEIGHAIDTIDIDQEWNYFKRNIAAPHLKVVSHSSNSEDERYSHGARAKKMLLRRISIAVTVAASVLLIILTRSHFFFDTGSSTPILVNEDKRVYATIKTRTEVNLSSKPKKLMLEDGSGIVLYENSEVSFEEGFPGNKRDIKLSGKADFTVSKDKTKPFTVHSGEVATTALGTKFTVTSYKKENKIVVRLYEGEVVVKSSVENPKKLPRDYLLIPGNELVYNKAKANATLRLFKTVTPAVNKAKGNQILIAEDPSFPKDTPGTWFMFNNQSLDQVFDQLALMFDRKIIYSKKEMHKIYFIGKFDKSDDLESILEQIATLNGLKFTRKNENFLIRKND